MPLKTRDILDKYNIAHYTICNYLRYRLISQPPRDSSGDMIWLPENIAELERAMRRQNKKYGKKAVAV